MPLSPRFRAFLADLRRRRVVQVLIAYSIVGWIVIEVADVVVEPLGLPPWTLTLVIVLAALGLPVAIVLAWVFDITPEGVKATAAVDSEVAEGTIVKHYVIVERLGEGGMGIVYRARDTRLDRSVALKFLPPHLTANKGASKRFLQEARAVARLDHPNICTIHEIGTLDDGRSFIAMAHYEGRTLDRIIEERRSITPDEVVDIAQQVGRGIARAHAAGIIHRDIKPANLFMTEDGIVKILDFGIAKVEGVDLTREGAALGTVAYMSPEQIRGEAVDARADLWSLGVLMYEMCAGERPFTGDDRVAVFHGILDLDPPPLESCIEDFPTDLSAIVARCLAKDRDARPADANALLEALERLADGQKAADGPVSDAASATAAGRKGAEAGLAPGLAKEGERRQATLLVAELAGRSQLEESLSPEESDELLIACREAMTGVVESHGGVVNRNTGEMVRALFGIPVAYEDDAIRAVRTACALSERVKEIVSRVSGREGVGLRCGIDSGRVVVRRASSGDRRYRVVGGTAEGSVRLAAQARADEVLISDRCRRLVAPFFEMEEAGALPGRTDDQTTSIFRVVGETGVRTRLEAVEAGDLTELTGREAELRTLLEASESALAGNGGFVSVVGDVGVGKSRLLLELERRIDEDRFDLVRGRCQSLESEVPYLPFIDALRDRLGLRDVSGREDAALVSERVRRIAPELEEFTPFYLQLLSVEDEEVPVREDGAGERLRLAVAESLSALLTLGAKQKPGLVMLEDWHWADAASRQVLRQLLEMVSAYPLLVVVTARPESELDWGSPAGHTPIVLGPLRPDDSAAIVRSVLDAEELPSDLARLLHDRTGGNPFFLEEVCQALQEDGTLRVETGRVTVDGTLDHLELPDTVQGVLRTRLDRLDGSTRRLVRYACVVGQEFSRDVLERALDDVDISEGLDRVRDLGLVQQIRVVPTPAYRFKHALTQEVAYDGLLERQRSEIHGAVGEALETLHPDRLDEHLDRLAEHFAQAGSWEKAVDYGVAAADRLRALGELQEAAEMQTRALEWAGHLPDDESRLEKRVDLLLRQERLLEFLGLRDGQQEIIDELFEILDPDRQASYLAATYVRQADVCILTHDYEAAERALESALHRCREEGDQRLERQALRSMGLMRWHQERYEEAIGFVERALELDRELDNEEGIVGNLMNLSNLYKSMGEHDRALASLEEALERERAIGRGRSGRVVKESYIVHNIGILYSAMGDNDRALEYLEEARASLEQKGSVLLNVLQLHYHLTAIARIYLEEDRLEEGLGLYRESIELCRKTRYLEGLSNVLRMLGEVLLNLERSQEALQYLEEAAELFAGLQDRPSEASMWRNVAKARETARRDGALEAWERTQELAAILENRSLEREAVEGVGRLLRTKDPAASLRAYQSALELAPEGDRAKRGGLQYTVGILHWESGAYEEALRSFESAHEDLNAGGDRVHAGLALNSIGRTLRDMGRLDEAKERLEASVELNHQTGERLLEAHALAALGDVHLSAGDADEATDRFTAALEIRKELDDLSGQGWMLYRLARAQKIRGSPDGVTYYLKEADEIASRTGDLELVKACDELRR